MRDTLANLQSHLVDIYAGDIAEVPVYLGGWIMTCDVFLYMRTRLRRSLTWGIFLTLIERVARQDIEFLRTPTAGQDAEELADTPFIAARLPIERARDAHVARSGVEIHPAMVDRFNGVGIPIPFKYIRATYPVGVTPTCPGYLRKSSHSNPVVVGLIRKAGCHLQAPPIPADVWGELQHENVAFVNLNVSSILRNARMERHSAYSHQAG